MPKIGKYNLQEQIKQQESDNWWEHDFNIYDYIFENDDSLILPNDPSKYKSKEQMIGQKELESTMLLGVKENKKSLKKNRKN